MFHVMSITHLPPVIGGFLLQKESHPVVGIVCLLREKGETIMGGEELYFMITLSIPYFQTNTTPKWTMLRWVHARVAFAYEYEMIRSTLIITNSYHSFK